MNDDYEVDMLKTLRAVFDAQFNSILLSDKEIAPVVKVCNKYGINGMQVFGFLMELGAVCQNLNEGREDG